MQSISQQALNKPSAFTLQSIVSTFTNDTLIHPSTRQRLLYFQPVVSTFQRMFTITKTLFCFLHVNSPWNGEYQRPYSKHQQKTLLYLMTIMLNIALYSCTTSLIPVNFVGGIYISVLLVAWLHTHYPCDQTIHTSNLLAMRLMAILFWKVQLLICDL